MAFKGGPHIQAACFCETVIEDKAGVLSLIRIIDTLTHTAGGPNAPDDMPPVQFAMKLVLMLKSGEAQGRASLTIVPQSPSGQNQPPNTVTVHFDGEDKGANVVVEMSLIFEHEGLYWFNIYLDDEKARLTAIPFRVKYNRIVTGTGPQL